VRPPYRRRLFNAALGIALSSTLLAACGGVTASLKVQRTQRVQSTSPSARVALPTLAPPAPIKWGACSARSVLRCSTVSVPIDYAHPAAGSITLAVSMIPATDPSLVSGTLFFNPGGPGESGNQILPIAWQSLPIAVRQHFNVVSFDPRGTGSSDRLECGTSLPAITSVAPVPASSGEPLPGTPAFSAMALACQARAAGIEPFIDTTNTARDMDRIRQALGLSSISYYGLSYGTVLGAVYADLFPSRVKAMVLDGAVDMNATLAQQAEEEAPAEEESLLHLFASCSAQPACPLGTDPEAFFERLAASLAKHPLPAPGGGDTTPVTVGDLDTATLFAITVPDFIPTYYAALTAAEEGNGTPLRSVALTLVRDIDGAPLVDAQWAITCNDAATHPGPVAAGNLARELNARYPLIGAFSVTYTMGGCVAWPRARQPVIDLHPAGAPPTLVIGNTGDPNTPIIEAKQLAAIFPKASMVTWRGWGHTWLLSGPGDKCIQGLVTTYLMGQGLPRSGTVCN
jgi:pimeloyl-ACP methyl ester carboxylesterase